MSDMLVAVPFARGALAGVGGDVRAHAPTNGLRLTFGLGESDDDQADRAALLVASVAALIAHGSRRVATALVRFEQVSLGPDTANGEVLVTGLAPGQLVAWFAEGDDVDDRTAAAAAAGLSLDDAWALPAVSALIEGAELLWHDIAEAEPPARDGDDERNH